MLGVEKLPGKPLAVRIPVVFHFQPKPQFVFEADQLHIWEDWMRKFVGFQIEAGFAQTFVKLVHTCTGTGTGDAGVDDCD